MTPAQAKTTIRAVAAVPAVTGIQAALPAIRQPAAIQPITTGQPAAGI